MIDPARLQRAIEEIAAWFQGPYRSPSGFPWADVHGQTGEPTGSRDLSSEIDDYVPLLRVAGYGGYASEQIELLAPLLDAHPEGLYDRPQMRAKMGVRFRLPGVSDPRCFDLLDLTEILFGLIESEIAGGGARELALAERFAEHGLRHFYRDGELRSWRWLTARWTLPMAEPLAGMVIEGLCDLARATGSERWLEPARSAARAWIRSDSFQRWGAFPSVRFTGRWAALVGKRFPATRRFELAKANTSMAWGLLALHRLDGGAEWGQALDRWLKGLDALFEGRGPLLKQLAAEPGSPVPFLILSTNFAIIDLFCDLAVADGRWSSLLERAARMTRTWIGFRFSETGLLPDEPGKDRSYLDANTDLAVSMLRLAELTGEQEFRQEAERTVEAVLDHHHAPAGFLRDVDGRTGEPLHQGVETRFVSLLLKPLLLLRSGDDLYGPDGVAGLMRDR